MRLIMTVRCCKPVLAFIASICSWLEFEPAVVPGQSPTDSPAARRYIHRTIGPCANAQRGGDDIAIASLTGHGDKLCESLKRIRRNLFYRSKAADRRHPAGSEFFFKFGTAFGVNARDAGTPEVPMVLPSRTVTSVAWVLAGWVFDRNQQRRARQPAVPRG